MRRAREIWQGIWRLRHLVLLEGMRPGRPDHGSTASQMEELYPALLWHLLIVSLPTLV